MRVPLIVPDVEAAILAGGHSRRMGTAKASLLFRGNTFMAHLLMQLQQQVREVVIVAGTQSQQFSDYGVQVLPDDNAECGPLEGIATALRHARRDWVLFAPCDNPVLPENYAARLLWHARQQQVPLVYVRKNGRDQLLYTIMQRNLLPQLEAYMAEGGRKVMQWFAAVDADALIWDDAGLAFNNLNTPEDYNAFLAVSESL